jgi:crotonobetainyl-CoA:carnitine CoA-transferase CaiB-like acyl-CoA transferase
VISKSEGTINEMPDQPSDEAPLHGVRVVDMSHLLAGPYCAQLLADQGADVIKVEPPAGDISRRRIPDRTNEFGDRVAAYFLSVNRGKRSVAVDAKTAEGRARVLGLLEHSDVLVENFRPEVLDRLLMPRAELAERFPRLVVVSISALGSRGIDKDLRDRPGLAIVGEALSGTLAYSRGEGDEPNWAGGFPLGDFTAGLAAHAAVVGALLRRTRTGRGGLLDISISDAMLSINSTALAKHGVTVGTDTPGENYRAAPYGIFPALDGYLVLGVNTDEFWRRLCVAMERPDLTYDERYAADKSRMIRKPEVDGLVAAWTRTLPRDELLQRLGRAAIPSAPVNYPADIVRSDIYRQRGMLLEVEDGIGGTIVLPANPLGPTYSRPRVPRLGEDPDAQFDDIPSDEPASGATT